MAAPKLYPTLSAFYKNTYIGFGSEANLAAGSDTQPNRKPLADDHKNNIRVSNITEDRVARGKGGKVDEVKSHRRINGSRPEASRRQKTVPPNNSSAVVPPNNSSAVVPPCLPSAPPMEWSDDLIERFLEDTLTQQQLFSLENDLALVDIPNIDYSTLRVPLNGSSDAADVSWVDDLIPDYDTTTEETGSNKLNNLNKEATTKEPQSPSFLVKNIVETEDEPNSSRFNLTPSAEQTHQSEPCLRQHRQAAGARREVIYRPRISRNQTTANQSGQSNAKVVQGPATQEKENRSSSSEDLSTSQRVHPSGSSPPPGSEEYSAWMTWRKQINRQLATAILLRGNHQSPLQKTDRGLSQSSYDFISQFARCGPKTPLGSKPFVMYGIPRVSLPNN